MTHLAPQSVVLEVTNENSANKHCDYSPRTIHPPLDATQPVALVTHGPCGPELTLGGRINLLQAANVSSDSELGLAGCVSNVMRACYLGWSTLLDEYNRQIHPWLPILDDDQRLDGSFSASQRSSPSSALLRLAIILLIRKQCGHPAHLRNSTLYQTVKQVLAILPSAEDPCAEFLQIHLLLALYECGHGMTEAAYLTLSSCVPLANLLSERRGASSLFTSQIDSARYRTMILILDRY